MSCYFQFTGNWKIWQESAVWRQIKIRQTQKTVFPLKNSQILTYYRHGIESQDPWNSLITQTLLHAAPGEGCRRTGKFKVPCCVTGVDLSRFEGPFTVKTTSDRQNGLKSTDVTGTNSNS